MSEPAETYTPDEIFEHSDLVLETTIVLLTPLKSTAERRDNKVIWTYQKTAELDDFVRQFTAGKIMVEPLAFSKMLRSIRNSVYALMEYDPPRLAHLSSRDTPSA